MRAERELVKQGEAAQLAVRVGLYPIATLEKQVLNMIGNLI